MAVLEGIQELREVLNEIVPIEKKKVLRKKDIAPLILVDEKYLNNFRRIIKINNYVKKCKSSNAKEIHSLSYLVDKVLSQSDCIKLGTGLENVMRQYIPSENKELVDLKDKNKKGIKEKDHLFLHPEKKIIYYAELKSNLNLDTEKSKATINKVIQINKELKEKYKGYEIKYFLVGTRYFSTQEIPRIINKKYEEIRENLFGVNEYLETLGIDINFDEKDYKIIINELAQEMFFKNS